jgi:hypothetical protein
MRHWTRWPGTHATTILPGLGGALEGLPRTHILVAALLLERALLWRRLPHEKSYS